MSIDVTFPTAAEVANALDPRSLELLILPTENCNFRCTYCYEDHVPGDMKPEIVAGVKQLIDRRMADLQRIRISWFGGEPLMAKRVVFEICEHVRDRCRETGVGHEVGGMTTNAWYLTPEVMARLSAANQRHFHITLDGYGSDHDRTRFHVNGRGTFERIWSNLHALQATDLDFDVQLRLHYGFANVAVSETLCRAVNEAFAGDDRFRVVLQRVTDLGGENSGKFEPLPLDEARARAERLASVFTDVHCEDVSSTDHGICYAAQPNHLIIRPDGRIAKCAVNLRDPRNTVGRLDADGRIHIDAGRLQPWMTGFRTLDPDLLTCPYQAVAATPMPQPVDLSQLRARTAPRAETAVTG